MATPLARDPTPFPGEGVSMTGAGGKAFAPLLWLQTPPGTGWGHPAPV
jgi:hypothetical protein